MNKLALTLALLLLIPTLCHAENWDDILKRLQQREKQFEQVVLDVDFIYRMLAEMYVDRFGEEKYNELIWGEKEGK